MATRSRRAAAKPDSEMPELNEERLKSLRPMSELLAAKGLRKPGRPPIEQPKVPVTIRLDAKVVAHFKASGIGWQTRLNQALVDLVDAERETPGRRRA